MTKVRCGRYSCQHCFGEYCELETITLTTNGCDSYRGELGSTDPITKLGNILSKERVSYGPRYGIKECKDVLE